MDVIIITTTLLISSSHFKNLSFVFIENGTYEHVNPYTRFFHTLFQVTRVVLLWVNNHFNDFEGDPAMTHFLEEFENNLEKEVSLTTA